MTDHVTPFKPEQAEKDLGVCLEQVAAATPGKWIVRQQGNNASQFFVQAPRLSPTDPYDIEVLGEDDTLYPTRRADADAIVGLFQFMRAHGPVLQAAIRALAAPIATVDANTLEQAQLAASNMRHGRWFDQADAIEKVIAALPTVPVVGVQQAWIAAGGNPGIKASREELLEALRLMDEAEDEAEEQAIPREIWHTLDTPPECDLENEWGFYARVLVQCENGERRRAIYDPVTEQFQVPFDGEEIGGVVGWQPAVALDADEVAREAHGHSIVARYRAAVDAIDGAHWLSGPLDERIRELIRERDLAVEGQHPAQLARAAQAAAIAADDAASTVVAVGETPASARHRGPGA